MFGVGVTAAGTLLLAVLLDFLIGDPETPHHPVALLGKLISKWETLFYKGSSPLVLRLKGALLVLVIVVPVYLISYLLLAVLEVKLPLLAVLVGGFFLWSTIAARSLEREARRIFNFLQTGDLPRARKQVGMIVGRDTENLNEGEIARATVETVAENISDGLIAPLFYFVIGGVPLACAYRAINTFDSMVGYQSERYKDFGWFAAKLDDVANYLPSRLTAVFLLLGAAFLGYNWRRALQITWRDRRQHPSPNSGYPEAAVAGALGIRLGGTNYYQGVPSRRPYLGDPVCALEKEHIAATIKLLYGALVAYLVIYGFISWLCLY